VEVGARSDEATEHRIRNSGPGSRVDPRDTQRPENVMTDTTEREELIIEALALIDRGIGEMQHRELVSTDEVADLLLDVRLLLTTQQVTELAAN
jgi:hypothetical protein